MSRTSDLPDSGDLIDGKFRIARRLGAGGMGVVFEAINTTTEKHVAIKFLSPELSAAPEAAMRFRREARATGRIHHPNVVAVHDSGEYEGRLYLVMELLQGVVLREWIGNRRIGLEAACQVLFPVMRGVAAAHAVGVLHCDLKPDNIFMTESPDGLDAVPKVVDFGLAKLNSAKDTSSQVSVMGAAMGTYQFMAPEQLRGQSALDARADVYAVGAILFSMLAGRPPYQADNPVDLALQVFSAEPPSIDKLASVPPGAAGVVAQALARDPNARFPSIEDLAVALEPYAGGLAFRGVGRRFARQAPAPVAPPSFGVTEQISVRALQTPYRPAPAQPTVAPAPKDRTRPLLWGVIGLACAALLVSLGLLVQRLTKPVALVPAASAPAATAPAAVAPAPAVPAIEAAPAPLPPVAAPARVEPAGITLEEPSDPNEWAPSAEAWPDNRPDRTALRNVRPEPDAPSTTRAHRHRQREEEEEEEAEAQRVLPAPVEAPRPAEPAPARGSAPSGRTKTVLSTDQF